MSMNAKKEVQSSSKKSVTAKALEALKKEGVSLATREWIDAHDELLDKAADNPIVLDTFLSDKLIHKTFSHPQAGETKFDWSEFRQALEMRNANSPRWFIQLREEDLLLGPHGLDGVTVDCFVVVEAKEPTLSPSEYVVKVHWPYSDAEDNAPERILPIAGQNMCWRRVVKSNGSDINVFLLQKRSDPTSSAASSASSFGFGLSSSNNSTSAPRSSAPPVSGGFSFGPNTATPPSFGFNMPPNSSAPASTPPASQGFGFSFGNSAPTAPAAAPTDFSFGNSAPVAAAPTGFSFGGAATTPSAPPASSGFSFGFGAPAAAPAAAPSSSSFGFGNSASSPTLMSNFGFGATPASSSSAPAANNFGFGSSQSSFGGASASSAPSPKDNPAVPTQQLKTSEVLFTLWSASRLDEMESDIKSGSRIVREGFQLDANTSMKLVMQNDMDDDAKATAHRLILTRLFAKKDEDVKEMDKWIDSCPVYDEELASALQEFRERRLLELAEESDDFEEMVKRYEGLIQAELERIMAIRRDSAALELEMIEFIRERIKRKMLLEKKHFRLLKYYAKNDVLPFRPFGKISGISEMGESVDVCVPPAHVNINPFTNKPMQ